MVRRFSAAIACMVFVIVGRHANAVPVPSMLAPSGVRDLATLKSGELAKLPSTTMVKEPKSGRIVSVAKLREEHDARMARFANAKAFGQSVLGRLGGADAPLLTRADGSSMRRPIGAAATSLPTISPADLAYHLKEQQPQLLPLETKDETSGLRFAKDYDDVCMQAKASVCIYYPNSLESQYPNIDLSQFSYLVDQDFLVNEQQCADGYGYWNAGGSAAPPSCWYIYPTISTVRWTETTPPSAKIKGSCLDKDDDNAPLVPFVTTYDHYGVFQLSLQSGGPVEPVAAYCVIKIKAMPT